ncbi:contractile injection system tape measure protein, partial [Roseateles sp. GG27B]
MGRAPDEALTAALPRPSAAEREEIDGLLAAVRNHWKALENTSAEGLRLSFLQRRGLLRRAEGAWQLHLQAEAFDVLLD